MDDVLDDIRRMDVRVYAEMATDRRYWRRLVMEARAHVGPVSYTHLDVYKRQLLLHFLKYNFE